jgi:pimeloyl-ACP methyl ester carboxylesterase
MRESRMIAYTVYGDGALKAIALHGLFADGTCFEEMLNALDPHLWSVVSPDIRGYGKSVKISGPYDMTTIAADALEIADHLRWDHFAAIGHSMSGKAVRHLAACAPTRISRIVGVAPVWAGLLPLTQEQLATWTSSVVEVEIRKKLISATVGERLTEFWCRQTAEQSFLISRPEAYAGYLRSFASDDFEAEALQIDQEVLVIAGAADAVTTKRAKEMWQNKLHRCELTILPDCGHWPIKEEPLRTASLVHAFLSKPQTHDAAKLNR